MLRKLALIVAAATVATGCAGPAPQRSSAPGAAMPLVACDDGGSGGVLIDGVCL